LSDDRSLPGRKSEPLRKPAGDLPHLIVKEDNMTIELGKAQEPRGIKRSEFCAGSTGLGSMENKR
jgi:hypothetical protein